MAAVDAPSSSASSGVVSVAVDLVSAPFSLAREWFREDW